MAEEQAKKTDRYFWVHILWAAVAVVTFVGGLIMNGTVINENKQLALKAAAAHNAAEDVSQKLSTCEAGLQPQKVEAVQKAIRDYCSK